MGMMRVKIFVKMKKDYILFLKGKYVVHLWKLIVW